MSGPLNIRPVPKRRLAMDLKDVYVGLVCHCSGDGTDIFEVAQVSRGPKGSKGIAFLEPLDGAGGGWENVGGLSLVSEEMLSESPWGHTEVLVAFQVGHKVREGRRLIEGRVGQALEFGTALDALRESLVASDMSISGFHVEVMGQ